MNRWWRKIEKDILECPWIPRETCVHVMYIIYNCLVLYSINSPGNPISGRVHWFQGIADGCLLKLLTPKYEHPWLLQDLHILQHITHALPCVIFYVDGTCPLCITHYLMFPRTIWFSHLCARSIERTELNISIIKNTVGIRACNCW